jgi:hypothetical protein
MEVLTTLIFSSMLVKLSTLLVGFISLNPLNLSILWNRSRPNIISPSAISWLEDIRVKYDLPGISLGAIASPLFTGTEWKNQTIHSGSLANGKPIDDEVSMTIN